jgi:hypothetical protein
MAKRTSVLIEKLVTACNGDLHAALRALLVVNEALDVNFQEVVHSAPAVNADVAKHTVIRGGPNELWLKVGDGGNREGGISWGCLTPPLLHRRSDMPCPKITSSS